MTIYDKPLSTTLDFTKGKPGNPIMDRSNDIKDDKGKVNKGAGRWEHR